MGNIANIPNSGSAAPIVDNRAYTAVLVPDLALGPNLTIHMTLTGNVTVANPANAVDAGKFVLRFLHDGAGHTISFGSAYRGSDDTPLTPAVGVDGATVYYAFRFNAASGKCDFVAPNEGFAA